MAAITQQGNIAIALPLLAIAPVDDGADSELKQAVIDKVIDLALYQHVIFISTNAVQCAWHWIDRYWPQLPIAQSWYAIGKATAAEITRLDISVKQAGAAMNSDALLSHADLQNLQQQKVLIVRGQGGREHLKTVLQSRGAQVDYCEVYKRHGVSHEKGVLAAILAEGLDFLTVSSAETIQRLLDQAMIDAIQGEILQIPIVVPGSRLFDVARSSGFTQIVQADNAGLQEMLKALKTTKKTINS